MLSLSFPLNFWGKTKKGFAPCPFHSFILSFLLSFFLAFSLSFFFLGMPQRGALPLPCRRHGRLFGECIPQPLARKAWDRFPAISLMEIYSTLAAWHPAGFSVWVVSHSPDPCMYCITMSVTQNAVCNCEIKSILTYLLTLRT